MGESLISLAPTVVTSNRRGFLLERQCPTGLFIPIINNLVKKKLSLTRNYLWVYLITMRGRPPKPPAERKTDNMKIPLTAEEKESIERAAQAGNDKPVTWARDVLLRAAKRRIN